MREISEFLEHGEITENTADFLEHYGVIGMKWGLRKAKPSSQSRAFRKSAKKALKLENRSNKTAVKGAKLVLKGVTKKKHDVYMKGLSLQLKSVKLQKKADRWEKLMRENFKDVSIDNIDEKSLKQGKAFIYMLANPSQKESK